MVPEAYTSFMVASAGASAALIGLLFVAVSIDPQRVFGRTALVVRQSQALSAFTALVNAFFISMGGLVPGSNLGILTLVMAVLSLSQTLALLRLWPRWRHERTMVSGLVLFVLSVGVYGYQLLTAVQLIRKPADTAALTTLLDLILGTYAIGLERAWELLGGPEARSLTASLRALITTRPGSDVPDTTADTPPPAPDR
jgi:hypothetical protein